MDFSWITTSWTSVLMVLLSTLGIYFALILFTRIAGLRSFSKMSSFDFAITVAIGSVIASTILTKNPPLIQSVTALGMLYIIQMSVAKLRRESSTLSHLVNNQALLLMKGSTIIEENLEKARITHNDLRAKLREANTIRFSHIKAVVMESTGEITVLQHNDRELQPDDELLKDVEGWNSP